MEAFIACYLMQPVSVTVSRLQYSAGALQLAASSRDRLSLWQLLTEWCGCVQKYGEEYTVVGIDKEAKVATLASGQKIQYEALVSTMPLDLTLHWLGQPKWAEELSHR